MDTLPFNIDYFSPMEYRTPIPIEKITYDNRYFINTVKYPTIKDGIEKWLPNDPILSRLPTELQVSLIKDIYCPNGTPKIGDKRANKIQTAQIEKMNKDNEKYWERVMKRHRRIMKKTSNPTVLCFE